LGRCRMDRSLSRAERMETLKSKFAIEEGVFQDPPSDPDAQITILSNLDAMLIKVRDGQVFLTRSEVSQLHAVLSAYLFDETLAELKETRDGNRSVSHSDDGGGGADVRPVSEPEDG
jgi:hypothetical protein